MKNKFLKKIVATFISAGMTLALTAPLFANTVKAEDFPKNVTITKKITKRADVYAPNTTFTFAIANGTAVTGSPAIYAGITGGVTFADNQITSTPANSDIGQTSITLSDTATLTVNAASFTKPGIYRYVITETAGNYEGLTYSTETKFFDVYVNSDKVVYSYAFYNASGAKDDAVFTNDYDKDKTKIFDLSVTKAVTGSQGDKEKEFSFTIKVDGASGEKYAVYKGAQLVDTLDSGVEKTITLKDGESFKITGLSATDTYTVNEADYSSDGYTTTNQNNTGTISADKTITVTNDKDPGTPTGIIMTYMPYVVLIAGAALLIIVFNKKRENTEV